MFTKRSEKRLEGVHKALVDVIREATGLSAFNVQISEGLRTLARQRELVAQGKSQTMMSYHLVGKAVDVVLINPDGTANWIFANYKNFADIVKSVAKRRGVRITWGGDWKTLRDGPHFQIETD